MVEYLDFRGHSQMFVVKVDGIDKLVKGVRSFRDLESKVGNLRKLKTQINETEKSNQSDAPSNIDQNPATFNVHLRRTTTSSTLPHQPFWKHEKYQSWFSPATARSSTKPETRAPEPQLRFKNVTCRTSRYEDSPIPYLTRLLNEN